MSDVSQIDGNAVRLRRESQGLGLADVATRACLSVKQVRQIEEGGMTAFYSETVKLTAARKVAGLLSMNEAELFGQKLVVMDAHLAFDEEDALREDTGAASPSHVTGFGGGLNIQNTPITRSEALHVLAQPPEHVAEEPQLLAQSEHTATAAEPNATENGPSAPVLESTMASGSHKAEDSASTPPAPANDAQTAGSGYFLKIAALFVVALAAAALLKPSSVEEKPSPPVGEVPAPPATPLFNPTPEAPAATQPVTAADSKPVPSETKPDAVLPKASEVKPADAVPATTDTKPAN